MCFWNQVSALKRMGLPAADAAKRVDMTSHKALFPQIQGTGVDERAVLRIYEVIDEKMK